VFHINVVLTVKDAADVDTVRDLLTTAMRMTREEPGVVRFDVFHSHDDPQVFLLCEGWEDEAAWRAHREREAVQTIYIPQVLPLVDRVPHVSTLLE
jgi:quinol monooxygenase YgiN